MLISASRMFGVPWNLLILTLALMSPLLVIRCSAQTRCVSATSGGGSCNFSKNQCDWFNLKQNAQRWIRYTSGTNDYMTVDLSEERAGSVAYLSSPLLCATGSDLHTFNFRYYIPNRSRCQLSVFLATKSNVTVVWTSTPGSFFSELVDPIALRCSTDQFQIVFAASPLAAFKCDEVAIDSIAYSNVGESNEKAHHCLVDSTTTIATETTPILPPITRTSELPITAFTLSTTAFTDEVSDGISDTPATIVDEHSNLEPSEKEGLDPGLISGLVVVVVVVVAFAAGGVLFLRRRRTKMLNKSQPIGKEIKRSHSVSNGIYIMQKDNLLVFGTGETIPYVIPQSHEADDVREEAGSITSNIYSVPDDLPPISNGAAPNGHFMDVYAVPVKSAFHEENEEKQNYRETDQRAAQLSHGDLEGDHYNNLLPRTSKANFAKDPGADCYDRLDQEGKGKDFSTNLPGDNEYSLAQIVHSAKEVTVQSSLHGRKLKSGYENVSRKDDDYDRLRLDEMQSAEAAVDHVEYGNCSGRGHEEDDLTPLGQETNLVEDATSLYQNYKETDRKKETLN